MGLMFLLSSANVSTLPCTAGILQAPEAAGKKQGPHTTLHHAHS